MQLKTLFIFCAAVTIVAACGATERTCGPSQQCYDPSSYNCLQDPGGNYVVCPTGLQACQSQCYPPSTFHCASGNILAGGAAVASPTQAATSSTNAATSSTKAATSSTTKASTSSTKAATSSTTKAATSSTTKPTTSSQAPAAAPSTSSSSSSCVTTGCGAGLCNCNGGCYSPGQYNCAQDSFTGKSQLCPGNFGSCNGYCYDTTKQNCQNGVLSNGAQGTSNAPAGTPSTTAAAATTAATSSPVVVNPSPVPQNYPTQTADLRIINNCGSTLWFEARYGGQGAPIPGQSTTAVQALPGGYVDYVIPATGLGGSRFWAKYGCDSNGKNCLIGDQMQYWPNPPGGCPAGGCTPPVDSLFEATWGCKPGTSCYSGNPTTWFDTSQVDGWTIPYKLTPNGDTSGCDCVGSQCGFSGVDASTLDLAKCPNTEDLSNNGQYASVNVNGQNTPLNSVDLRIINNGYVLGCMSPCKRLNWGTPYGLAQSESSGSTMWMCCPTPTPASCSPSNGCVTPNQCRAGPIVNTQYVSAVHRMAPGVYSYSYDDGVGLHACPAGVVTYTMTFCPTGSASYPLKL